jgi:exopolyphosphatase/guanosine-5'-triphosphate,3'-diphosphate pyrophosphatase
VPPELRASDLEQVRVQLGREPTTTFEVVARCAAGHPLVIRNGAFDAERHPFPTTFWLTCPDAAKSVSRIESTGAIAAMNERFETDPAFRAGVERAHGDAAAERGRTDPGTEGWGGVGGTRTGLKCLHAHYANHLAGGDDVVGAWVAGQVEPIHPDADGGPRIAVIDQGTHSCRLLVVAQGHAGEPIELAQDMIITKLGQGVDATGSLDVTALDRTEAVLARYCRRARALGAEDIRVTATSAVRDAANRQAFSDMVLRHAHTEPRVIDGTHEGALAFLGGTRGLDPGLGPFVLVDIGGGSTEFVLGREPGRSDDVVSTQMGSVRLTERHVRSDPPLATELAAMRAAIEAVLDDVEVALPTIHTAATIVSVAGTATTLQAIALGLERYDPDATHRSWLTVDAAEDVLSRLAAMTNPERAAIPVMAPGRGDVIVAGGMILVTVMHRFGFERTLVSETDILLGLALEGFGVK